MPNSTLCIHAASESDADLLHATGFVAPDPFFWFRKGRRSWLVVSPLEIGRAKATARVDGVIDYWEERNKLLRRTGGIPRYAEVMASILTARKVASVTVPERFPVGTADTLRDSGIAVEVRRDPFFPQRIVKRPDELAAIRTAQAATEEAVHEAIAVLRAARRRGDALRHGGEVVSSESLKRVIDVSLMRNGCVAKHTIVAIGDQCVDPHHTGHGPVRPNQSVIMDVFPRHAASGYFADMTRTVVRGKASKELREVYAAVEAGQQYAFDRIRGGADAQAIHAGIEELFAARGFRTGRIDGRMQGYFHGTGHGVGLDIHELPSFGKGPSTLPAGTVVTVEPGLYYERIGGVRLEDMVLVTEEGCENLTHFPKELEL